MQEEHNCRNIIIIGMPGAGKTYIGNKLAKLISHFSHVDIDEKIEDEQGTSICQIFATKGEKYFRKLETDAIKEVSKGQNQIISLGGGAFENPENIEILKACGSVFYLRAPVEELYNRIKDETHRPLLKCDSPLDAMKRLLKKREKNYLKAHFIIDTNQKHAYTILNDIITECENYAKIS